MELTLERIITAFESIKLEGLNFQEAVAALLKAVDPELVVDAEAQQAWAEAAQAIRGATESATVTVPLAATAKLPGMVEVDPMLARIAWEKVGERFNKIIPPKYQETIMKILSPILLFLFGWFGRGLMSRREFRNLSNNQLRKLLNISLTYFLEGNSMRIITLLEDELEDVFTGRLGQALCTYIDRRAQNTTHDQIVINLIDEGDTRNPERRAKQVYDTLRNVIFDRYVNPLRTMAEAISGKEYTEIKMVGVLTEEPQFTRDGQVEANADTQQKKRLLIFPENYMTTVLEFCKTRAEQLGGDATAETVMESICSEGSNKSPDTDALVEYMIENIDNLPRTIDRKRFVAMAQVAREIRDKKPHARFAIPVPKERDFLEETLGEEAAAEIQKVFGRGAELKQALVETFIELRARTQPERMAELLRERGGEFFATEERMNSAQLSFQMREPAPKPGELFYEGLNGTTTTILTNKDKILLVTKEDPSSGALTRALPGGFVKDAEVSRRQTGLAETAEEAIDIEKSSAGVLSAIEGKMQTAEAVYHGPVVSRRNHPDGSDAQIWDHVYHAQLDDVEGIELRGKAIDPDAVDKQENVGNAQWYNIADLFRKGIINNMFESHGTVLREWCIEHLRRLEDPGYSDQPSAFANIPGKDVGFMMGALGMTTPE